MYLHVDGPRPSSASLAYRVSPRLAVHVADLGVTRACIRDLGPCVQESRCVRPAGCRMVDFVVGFYGRPICRHPVP